MRTFKDNAGRDWTVAINVNAIKRVRDLAKVNLLDVFEGKLIDRLAADPVLLCDVLYAVCKPQADTAGVSDEQFGEALAGDAIELATKALLEELVSFSPNPRDRAALGRVIKALWNSVEKARDLLEARMNSSELENRLDIAMRNALETALGPSSGSVPASSEPSLGS